MARSIEDRSIGPPGATFLCQRDWEGWASEIFNCLMWPSWENKGGGLYKSPEDRYFTDSDFMSARITRRASTTWRAIVAGREALNMGIIYRIGNGEKVSIWNDNLIPGSIGLKPLGLLTDKTLLYVSELIDHSAGTWKESLIKETFAERWGRRFGCMVA